jgi:lysophospholipase L1-like esterase
MTRIKSLSRFAAVVVATMLLAAPLFAAARGKADFTKFVALGDSYGAGFESGSLNSNHQQFSWPAVIARQAGAPDFQQPTVSFPGISNELQLVDVISYPPVVLPATGPMGVPTNLNLQRPYNNLSIPGANVSDLTTLTGAERVTGTATAFAQFILRGQGTAVQQALAQSPTFIAIWIGGNDLLGSVLNGTPKFLTPTDVFKTAYNKMLDQLIAADPNAGMVVGNMPTNAASLPFLNTVPPVLINPKTRTAVIFNGAPIPLIAELGDGTVGALPTGSFVLLPYGGQIATGYGIPAFLKADPLFASLPNIGKPLLDAWVLTPAEATQIAARAVEYNQVINDAASARNIPVADINGLFNKFSDPNKPFRVGPFTFSASYISGGLFSLDGFHMTDLGYTLFANQYIRTINAGYGTSIPVASITTLLANNGAFFPEQSMTSGNVFIDGMQWTISDEAKAEMLQFAAPVAKKHRAIGH